MRTEYSKEDKNKIIPIADNLRIMEKGAGWKWLKNEIETEVKKELDFWEKEDDINNDICKGKIRGMKLMFERIDFIYSQAKKIRED